MNINQPEIAKEHDLLEKVLNFKLVLDSKHKICFNEIADKVELEISKEPKTRLEKYDVTGLDRNSFVSELVSLQNQHYELTEGKREEECGLEPLKTELEKLGRKMRQVSNKIKLIDKQGILETLLLGEFVPLESKVILYVKNIEKYGRREQLLILTFIHEMFHAWNYHMSNGHNEVVREIEEPMVEFGTLVFPHEISKTEREFQPILELAKYEIQKKQESIGQLAAYGFGYYLYSLLDTKKGRQAKKMLEEYGEMSRIIGKTQFNKNSYRVIQLQSTSRINYQYKVTNINRIVEKLKYYYPFDKEADVFDWAYNTICSKVGHVWKDDKTVDILKLEYDGADFHLKNHANSPFLFPKTIAIAKHGDTYKMEIKHNKQWHPIYNSSFDEVVMFYGFLFAHSLSKEYFIVSLQDIKRNARHLESGLDAFQKSVLISTYISDTPKIFEIKDDAFILEKYIPIKYNNKFNYFSLYDTRVVFNKWYNACSNQVLFGVLDGESFKILDDNENVSYRNNEALQKWMVEYDRRTHTDLFKEADHGDIEVQFVLAEMYEKGEDIRLDKKEAILWYRKAAESGHREAQYRLGTKYQNGDEIKQNYTEAAKWYLEAAKQGHEEAAKRIGDLFKDVKFVKSIINPDLLIWYSEKAAKGDVLAQYNLGALYQNGHGGISPNATIAIKWYRKAAEQRHNDAMKAINTIFSKELEIYDKDDLEWYIKTAMRDNTDACFNLGNMYQNGWGFKHDYTKAVKWYRKAVEQGYNDAMKAINTIFSKELELYDGDDLEWYVETATRENVDACLNLGKMYRNGWGFEQDCVEAVKWYRRALEKGHKKEEAFAALDEIFENEFVNCSIEDIKWYFEKKPQLFDRLFSKKDFVEHIDNELIERYIRRAENNEIVAQYNLGLMYQNGWGVIQDNNEAAKWYRRAQKYEKAKAALDEICSNENEIEKEILHYSDDILHRAERGWWEDCYKLVLMYLDGWEVKQDYVKAVYWYCKAAEQGKGSRAIAALNDLFKNRFNGIIMHFSSVENGNEDAWYNLGKIYRNGWGVRQDYAEAVRWYRKAVEKGCKEAIVALNQLFSNEFQLNDDDLRWYIAFAERGGADEHLNLGRMYQSGWGVKRSLTEAAKWYKKAGEEGNIGAKLLYCCMLVYLDPKDLEDQ